MDSTEIVRALDLNTLRIDIAEGARGLMQRYSERRQVTVQSYLEGGALLVQLKELLPYGAWLPALVALQLPERTAQEQMAGARRLYDKSASLADLGAGVHVVQLLGRKSIPDEVVVRVLEGEIEPTEEAIKEAVTEARSEGGGAPRPRRGAAPRIPAESLDPIEAALAGLFDYIDGTEAPEKYEVADRVREWIDGFEKDRHEEFAMDFAIWAEGMFDGAKGFLNG
jgi:hypothetical protein